MLYFSFFVFKIIIIFKILGLHCLAYGVPVLPTRWDRTLCPRLGRPKSQPLDHQGIPSVSFLLTASPLENAGDTWLWIWQSSAGDVLAALSSYILLWSQRSVHKGRDVPTDTRTVRGRGCSWSLWVSVLVGDTSTNCSYPTRGKKNSFLLTWDWQDAAHGLSR